MCKKGIQVFKTTIQKIYKVPKFSSEWRQHIIHSNLPFNAEK